MLSTFKRFFLLALLVLTGVSAVIIGGAVYQQGCSAGALEWAVKGALGSGLLFVVSFAAFTALDRPRWQLVSICGMLLAGVMLLVLPAYVGWEILDPVRAKAGALGIGRAGHEEIQKLVETGLLTSALFCLVPFVMIPEMKRVGRIVQLTTVLYSTAAYFAALMELWDMSGERVQEAVVTMLIPAGVCMMGVFVLHKFFEVGRGEALCGVSSTVELKCPRCQSEQSVGLGDSRCGVCRLKFTIEVEEPKCPNCGFNLHHLTHPVCPECGLHLSADDVPGIAMVKPSAAGAMPAGISAPAAQ